METIKTSIDEVKTKGAKADLSELKTQLESIKSKTDQISESKGTNGDNKGGMNYWSIGACGLSAVAVVLLGYIAFFKPSNGRVIEREANE